MEGLEILFIWWEALSNLLFLFSCWVNIDVSEHIRTEALYLTGAGVSLGSQLRSSTRVVVTFNNRAGSPASISNLQ